MSDPPKNPRTVRFHYIKNSTFTVIHADGAFGGVTPAGGIHLAFFNERFPIPTQTEHTLDGNLLGPEISEARVARDGLVRELLIDVVMDLERARVLHRWLGEQINLAATLSKDPHEEEEP